MPGHCCLTTYYDVQSPKRSAMVRLVTIGGVCTYAGSIVHARLLAKPAQAYWVFVQTIKTAVL